MAVINRVRQFWNAIFSQLNPEDLDFLNKYLNENELTLFSAMDRPTQTHCVRVARTTLKMLQEYSLLNKQMIIKAALLHDIGKPPNGIRTVDRVLIVLLKKFAPAIFDTLVNCSRIYGHFHKAIISHVRHAKLGAELAETNNLSEEIVYLIKNHHEPATKIEPIELTILREADNLN